MIISNTCVGSYIQRDFIKKPYDNPFCWNIIPAESMKILITDFHNINFKKYKLVKDEKWNFSVIIDDKVKVNYVHYLFSKDDAVPRIKNVDVYYNKIWEYIVEKYEIRTQRMLSSQEEPIFIIGTTWPGNYYNKNEIEKIVSIDTKYKIIVANNNIEVPSKSNVFFHKTNLVLDNEGLAKEIYHNFIFK